MSEWWLRRSRRLGLAVWFALLGDAALAICAAAGLVLGVWKPGENYNLWVVFGGGLAAGAISLFGIGYLLTGWALRPVRETVELGRIFSGHSERKRIAVENPNDELGGLAVFLNELLEKLQGSFVELDRLAADVSHELRTPLTAMRTVGEVAMRERNPAILYDAVGSMLEEIRRMNQLIDRLLLLTRSDSDKWPVRPKLGLVRSVLMEVSDTLRMVADEKQQQLEVICPSELKGIFDPALLRLALMNLTQNAIRYSPTGKTITLKGTAEEHAVVIEVADEGPGIAPEHQKKIFQRFYRVDDARSRAEGGVGLGLAIVKWSVERMGGTVELDSQVGRGSIFRVRLTPVIANPASAPSLLAKAKS